MSKPSPTRPTLAQVREFYRARPERVARLSERAQHTLAEGARGRVPAEVVSDYNRGRKPERQYVVGVGVKAKAEAAEQRAALREQGLAGTRGPLSKAAKAALAQSKG